MKPSVAFLIITFGALSGAMGSDFLSDVQKSLDLAESVLIQRNLPDALLAFERARFLVLTNADAINKESPEFMRTAKAYNRLLPDLPVIGKVQSAMDVAERSLLDPSARVALDSFENLRFLVFIQEEVVQAEPGTLKQRLVPLTSSAESGALKEGLNDQKLQAEIRDSAVNNKAVPPPPKLNGGYWPWPLCLILQPCE